MTLLEKAHTGARLSFEEAVALFDLPLFDLAGAAHAVRLLRTDPERVSYLIDRNINYSNVCNVGCAFCGFYRTKRQEDAYTLSYGEISDKVRELEAVGGTRILMQGGVNPYLDFSWYTDLLQSLENASPDDPARGFLARRNQRDGETHGDEHVGRLAETPKGGPGRPSWRRRRDAGGRGAARKAHLPGAHFHG